MTFPKRESPLLVRRAESGARAPHSMAAVVAAALLLLGGCASTRSAIDDIREGHSSIGTASSPATPWTPPVNTVAPPKPSEPQLVLPANYRPGMTVSLAEVVDMALSNNTATRIAWLQARAAEAALGSSRSAYLPEIDLDAQLSRGKSSQGIIQTTYGPSLALNYILFDFGGRSAQVEQARQTLVAADFLHNQAIQDVILRAQQSYYGYLDSKALLAAQDATLKERQTALDAAEARHRAGVATIADVLQARTALSQAQLNRESIEGNLRTWEGALATIMGLPATTRFEFGDLPLDVPAQQVAQAVDALITQAITERPDLAAARAFAERARARVREVRAQGLPTVDLSGNIAQTWVGGGDSVRPYSAAVVLRWPVFTGFRNTFDVREAEFNARAATENVRAVEQQVNLQVWSSYYALQTAAQRLGTSRDLLASAQQSADVAAERYRAGVGSILDLLTAESALESARAQEVQARTDWFLAVAQLARDTGSLGQMK